MDTLVFEVALLVGHVGDQFLVQASPDVGEIDCLHGRQPLSRCQSIARPPLTSTQWPVMKPESSPATKAIVWATSSGVTRRPMGLLAPSRRTSSAAKSLSEVAPATVAGETRLAVIPCGATSSATYRTNWSIAALAVPWLIMPSRG